MSQTSRPLPDARTGTILRRHILQVLSGNPPEPLLRATRPHVRRALDRGTPRDEVDTLASDFVLACAGPDGQAFTRPLLERGDAELPGALAALAVELRERRATAPPPPPARFPLVGERGLSLDARLGAFIRPGLVVEQLRDALSPLQFAWVGLAWRGLDERAAAAALGLDPQQAAALSLEAADALEHARFELQLG